MPSLRHLCVLVIAALVAPAVFAFDKPPYPRLGGYLIGSPHNYDDANYQASIARLSVAVLNVWPGWTGADGNNRTMSQVLANIKGRNQNTQLFLYMNINELRLNDPLVGITASNNRWWLYQNGNCCSVVKSNWGADFFSLNTSIFNTPYLDYIANYQKQHYYDPGSWQLDGFYTDNVFSSPRIDGDWNRDGSTDARGDPQVQTLFRQGYRYYFDRLRQIMPGKMQIANMGFQPGQPQPEYEYQLNGGVMEGLIGYSWSVDEWGGFDKMMGMYRETLYKIADPKLAIFHTNGAAWDYRTMRYGLASCLMDDGYFFYSIDDNYSGVAWFDEYNANLGYATSSPATASWQGGVYRRDFQNGIVLVNPKGNGTRQVFLEDDFVKINGSQDRSVNDGSTVRSVTLQDHDGIVLMRRGASSAPAVAQPSTPVAQPTPVSSSSSSSSSSSAALVSSSSSSSRSSTPLVSSSSSSSSSSTQLVSSSSSNSSSTSSSSTAVSSAPSTVSSAPAGAKVPMPPAGLTVR